MAKKINTPAAFVPKIFKTALLHLVPDMDWKQAAIAKIDESLSPNMRALRLTMTVAEKLLSMGVAARDVVYMSLGITRTYCTRPVHMDVSSTLITLSQDRGNNSEPLTMIRTIVPDDANYQLVYALQDLARRIRYGNIALDDAEKELEQIITHPKEHSLLVRFTAGGGVSAGIVVMYGGSCPMILLAFIMGFFATFLIHMLGKINVTTFYTQIFAALAITLVAAISAWCNTTFDLGINPTLIVISGIVMLVAGMMIVGAFQDAIDEYYITANARLLRVIMATSGIVIGVLAGLYISTRFLGINFPATPDRLTLASTQLQYIGAGITAAAFATRNHVRFFGMIIAGLVGVFGWWISLAMMKIGFGIVIASGAAATIIGLSASLVSRLWRMPSIAIIGAGIVPLVPGLSLYNGLMGIVENPPGDPKFTIALGLLTRAVMIGFAVAAGASLGNTIGRPLRRFLARLSRRSAAPSPRPE